MASDAVPSPAARAGLPVDHGQRPAADLPGGACSHLIDVRGQRWHVQRWDATHAPQAAGRAVEGERRAGDDRAARAVLSPRPGVLMVHGTGASTHSFRALAPLLARRVPVLAVDLPGHGRSGPPPDHDWSLPGLARQLSALCRQLQTADPAADAPFMGPVAMAVGHSAGAAILAQAHLHAGLPMASLVSINGAFLPFGGVAAPLLSPLARLLYAVPGVPGLFSQRAADPAVVRRLIEGTGSRLDEAGLADYARLMRDPGHTRAALAMMAHWELQPLVRDLPRLRLPMHLLAGTNDRAVPPAQARRVAGLVPGATLALLPGLGHLAHEEAPDRVAALMQAPLETALMQTPLDAVLQQMTRQAQPQARAV
jgi:magnesium chelatase accessory protein